MLKYVSCIKSSHDLCSPCVYVHVSAKNKCSNTFVSVCYPVMIKVSAGSGGKGMGIARNDDEASM
jgi:acetyl/propionyl-CoA carboxylase alpha subunit